AAHRRRHAARVPVEPEDAAERLEPERIGETPEDLVRALFGGQVDQDLARQPHHAAEQPGRSFTAVKWKGCEAGVTRHHLWGPSLLGPRHFYRPGAAVVVVLFLTDCVSLPSMLSSAGPPRIQRIAATMSFSQSM